MVATIPAADTFPCPRCKFPRVFPNFSAGGVTYRCGGCEWTFTLSTQAPTGTTNAAINTPATVTALSVASGGASFTNLMWLLLDTGTNAEVTQVTGTATGTSIPIAAGGLAKTHLTAMAFGQLLVTPAFNAVGEDAVPAAPGWGF